MPLYFTTHSGLPQKIKLLFMIHYIELPVPKLQFCPPVVLFEDHNS